MAITNNSFDEGMANEGSKRSKTNEKGGKLDRKSR